MVTTSPVAGEYYCAGGLKAKFNSSWNNTYYYYYSFKVDSYNLSGTVKSATYCDIGDEYRTIAASFCTAMGFDGSPYASASGGSQPGPTAEIGSECCGFLKEFNCQKSK